MTNRLAPRGPRHADGPVPGGGHGIIWMRERAMLLGGTLQADAERGGFRLAARLPYREAAVR